MKNSNNILIAATQEHQKTMSIRDFIFTGCTGVIFSEFTGNPEKDLKAWVKTLTDCSAVVTAGNWGENTLLFSLIYIARTMKIDVIHESNFQKYVEQQHN